MLKKIVFSVLVAQKCLTGFAESIKPALIENGFIRGATHYCLSEEGSNFIWDTPPYPVIVKSGPKAFFYGYDENRKKSIFLGAVTFKKWNKEQEEIFDKLIDPQASAPKISYVNIKKYLSPNHHIEFYDENYNIVIKCQRFNDLPFIKPDSLLSSVKDFTETSLNQQGNDFFFPEFTRKIIN